MLYLLKKMSRAQHQRAIAKKAPGVQISLHPDMPNPSLGKMAEVARLVQKVNDCEARVAALSDRELRAKTEEFRAFIARQSAAQAAQIDALEDALYQAALPEEKESIKEKIKHARNKCFEDILPEAFAVVREASKRTIGLRHFDVQIAGGIILHEGRIAEMSTGEGKTLVATLPAYLNALLGKGVHIVTVNDYLARRDREWMGPVYEFLGLTVGAIQHEMSDQQRQVAYACDITYGTNNEFGFDYLRDNMKYSVEELVQRPFFYAIVDEVDSILIDEARTPLIISGPAEESTDKYFIIDRLIPKLKGKVIMEKDEINAKHRGEDITKGFDYIIDEKAHTAYLTDEGESRVAEILNVGDLSSMENMEWRHHIIQALRAHNLYKKDVDYVVKEGEVIIVDEFTGRLMPGRRWSDGLHQAVEAKEGMKIERENQTLATITFQNYFRMYEKLSGMTGTAFTEANEFKGIYKLDVVVIPTNRPLIRKNYPDAVYKTEKEKFTAVVEQIVALQESGQPVLVGTISIEKSEVLSHLLKMRGITHQVLNAKYHEMEAQIVAQAGRYKGVTIATNMAGRGTDILLGGNPEFMAKSVARQKLEESDPEAAAKYKELLDKYRQECRQEHEKVVDAGGLFVIGTERHEARRVDNQLRGRCGRQGDPGASKFFVSLGDDLMRLFGSERLVGIMETLGLQEGEVIEHPLVTRSIEIAQKRVEAHNFEVRKQLLDYDNVMNKQREVIYAQRRQLLEGASLQEQVQEMFAAVMDREVSRYASAQAHPEEWDVVGLSQALRQRFGIEATEEQLRQHSWEGLREEVKSCAAAFYAQKEKSTGADLLRYLERMSLLHVIDAKWKDHLYAMDSLREGIGLRAYGQRDPLVEYKREAFAMFSAMMETIEDEAVELMCKVQAHRQERMTGAFSNVSQQMVHPEVKGIAAPAVEPVIPGKINQGEGPFIASDPGQGAMPTVRNTHEKVGRNDSCPCGSGKKYKKCCGK